MNKHNTLPRRFLITIDTEGDNMWKSRYSGNSVRYRISVRNGAYLPRFQQLCEKYGFKPTYLVNYEMCSSRPFVEMARDGLKRGMLEIGMHMHAWNCPPYYELTPVSGPKSNPYIGEYPHRIIEEKVRYLTGLLKKTFQTPVVSHRSGRWYLEPAYLKILGKYGIRIDCSVTPGIDWSGQPGVSAAGRGTDYTGFTDEPYEMDIRRFHKKGKSGIYEVPVTIDCTGKRKKNPLWLRPDGNNASEMCRLVRKRKEEGCSCVEFMLHSSELMPGGSPVFVSDMSVEKLYDDMERLFCEASALFSGATLNEFVSEQYGLRQGGTTGEQKF